MLLRKPIASQDGLLTLKHFILFLVWTTGGEFLECWRKNGFFVMLKLRSPVSAICNLSVIHMKVWHIFICPASEHNDTTQIRAQQEIKAGFSRWPKMKQTTTKSYCSHCKCSYKPLVNKLSNIWFICNQYCNTFFTYHPK